MTYIPYDNQQYSRKSHDESAGSAQFLYDGLSQEVQRLITQPHTILDQKTRERSFFILNVSFQQLRHFLRPSRTKLGLILIWLLVLWWGEKRVFRSSIEICQWDTWEAWPPAVTPHHVVLLADPQLVDPHTYPGRPWPLSTFTVWHTDLYMRRAFSSLQQTLQPETAFFLGDLFDGGREWATGKDKQADLHFKNYDTRYWLKEYARFSRIFLDRWTTRQPTDNPLLQRGKLIASLPGNHDLGIGNGIPLSVRSRFETFFGKGNRIDIVGNHTFVSVDSVSLSAKGQAQSDNTRHVPGQQPNQEIWEEADDFLSHISERKATALIRELRTRAGKLENPLQNHTVRDIGDPLVRDVAHIAAPSNSSELPTILLTHVPLYRSPGTPCGPLRERWPPSTNVDDAAEPLATDERNAISVSAGYQYQNVLQPDLSKELIEKIGHVQHVFSGDDHDYCEIVHHGYTSKGGGVREITVKSFSWAMGVRKPGFLMVSLWNPIDENGINLSASASDRASPSLQTHLCLLPDQLRIFIRYGLLLALTLFILVVRAFMCEYRDQRIRDSVDQRNFPSDKYETSTLAYDARDGVGPDRGTSSSNFSTESYQYGLAARSSAGRPRSASPIHGYGMPESGSIYSMTPASKKILGPSTHETARPRPPVERGMRAVWREFKQSTMQVAAIGLLWYAWLAYTS
ncbi:hypothetical protein MMC26_006725 [Xylographa opegraphella]|nr:hypothetical protein [Xylographa opegraphella]